MTDALADLISRLRAMTSDLYAAAADALTAQQARERDLDAKLAVHVEALALARTKSAKLSEAALTAALTQARKSAFEEAENACECDACVSAIRILALARAEEKTG